MNVTDEMIEAGQRVNQQYHPLSPDWFVRELLEAALSVSAPPVEEPVADCDRLEGTIKRFEGVDVAVVYLRRVKGLWSGHEDVAIVRIDDLYAAPPGRGMAEELAAILHGCVIDLDRAGIDTALAKITLARYDATKATGDDE